MFAQHILRVGILLVGAPHCVIANRVDVDMNSQVKPETVFGDMAQNVVQCIEPDIKMNPSNALFHLSNRMKGLRSQNVDNKGLKLDGWANRPFASNPISYGFPYHMTVGLVHSQSKYTDEGPTGKDAFCFEFDYNNASAADPSGCRIFEKSFKPLKELRNCIIDHLKIDDIWVNHRGEAWDAVKKLGGEDLKGFESADYDTWCRKSVYDWVQLAGVKTYLPVELCTTAMDTYRRAEEMIKFALFKAGGQMTPAEKVPQSILRKIKKTTSWPGMKQGNQQSLTETTVNQISEQCFKVKNDAVEDYFGSLQRVGQCLPLMYDKTEIGDGFGFQDGYLKLSNLNAYKQPINLHLHHIYDLPPVCGRFALAAIPKIQSARYHLLPSLGSVSSGDKATSWLDCINADYTNCRKAYFCWEKSLNRMCGIDEMCCPEGMAQHERCKADPSGRCAGMAAD